MTPREGVCHEDGQPHRCGRCDRDIIEAHPAATAREEAWKAMVEALTYIASHRGLTLLGDGSYSDGVRDGWIELADAADRALALARSTGGA